MNSKDERPTPDEPADVARERERVGAAPPAGLVRQSLGGDDPSFSTSNEPHASSFASAAHGWVPRSARYADDPPGTPDAVPAGCARSTSSLRDPRAGSARGAHGSAHVSNAHPARTAGDAVRPGHGGATRSCAAHARNARSGPAARACKRRTLRDRGRPLSDGNVPGGIFRLEKLISRSNRAAPAPAPEKRTCIRPIQRLWAALSGWPAALPTSRQTGS